MDWANQPFPFRCYSDTATIDLMHGDDQTGPSFFDLYTNNITPQPVNDSTISQFFYYSMALSAWKKIPGGDAWPLRVNPSSGNLHPTESYLVGCLQAHGSETGGSENASQIGCGVYHYNPLRHQLEQRRSLDLAAWQKIARQIPADGFLVGLSSIFWRETWKYGERGFRYANHDVGHALAALTIAAACFGWESQLIDSLTTEQTSIMLGCHEQQGVEAEHADCILAIFPRTESSSKARLQLHFDAEFLDSLRGTKCLGTVNQLSRSHHDWPIVEETALACRKRESNRHISAAEKDGENPCRSGRASEMATSSQKIYFPTLSKTAYQIIRQRRSAVEMDGATTLEDRLFFGILQRLRPDINPLPFNTLPGKANIALFIFVHRVETLPPGLYVLVREDSHLEQLKSLVPKDFIWRRPMRCPDNLAFYLLAEGNMEEQAQIISCHQEIASRGVFSLGMVARFDSLIREKGAYFYPRLFWEAGMIGQQLYLEAEAAGLRGTGIGCYFDDVMHQLLGIRDRSWQSLYHFTVGGPEIDTRLQTLAAYHHLT